MKLEEDTLEIGGHRKTPSRCKRKSKADTKVRCKYFKPEVGKKPKVKKPVAEKKESGAEPEVKKAKSQKQFLTLIEVDVLVEEDKSFLGHLANRKDICSDDESL